MSMKTQMCVFSFLTFLHGQDHPIMNILYIASLVLDDVGYPHLLFGFQATLTPSQIPNHILRGPVQRRLLIQIHGSKELKNLFHILANGCKA
jgi:hypothetical protein